MRISTTLAWALVLVGVTLVGGSSLADPLADDHVECEPFELNGADQCSYVRETHSCRELMGGRREGLIFYGAFYFCDMSSVQPLAVFIMITELILLFVCLSEVAETFFAPIMGGISDELGLSHNVAGVTFLAFANGAPDIFASFAAITTGKADLGLSALFGASVFIPVVVLGIINVVAEGHKLTRRPFIRDLVFLVGIVWFIYAFFLKGSLDLAQSIGVWSYYVLYVIVVILSRAIYQRIKRRRKQQRLLEGTISDAIHNAPAAGGRLVNPVGEDHSHRPAQSSHSHKNGVSPTKHEKQPRRASAMSFYVEDDKDDGDEGDDEAGLSEDDEIGDYVPLTPAAASALHHGTFAEIDDTFAVAVNGYEPIGNETIGSSTRRLSHISRRSSGRQLLDALNNDELIHAHPVNRKLPRTSVGIMSEAHHKLEEAAKDSYFAKFMYWAGRPIYYAARFTVPMCSEEMWDWRLAVLCTSTGPLVFMVAFKLLSHDGFPTGAVVIAPFLLLSAYFFKVLRHSKAEPRFVKFFLFIGFLTSVSWFEMVASELVNLLATLGVIVGLSQNLLGLTILAWGNSVADVVANMTVARMGFPKMAVGASIGGPLFNLSIGVGISMMVNNITNGVPFELPASGHVTLSVIFNTATCLLHVVMYAFFFKFHLNKKYGIFLLASYVTFVVLNVLVFTETIHIP